MIEMSQSFKKSGRSATLTMSTRNGQATKVKLEVELDDTTPSSVSPSPTSTSTDWLPANLCHPQLGRRSTSHPSPTTSSFFDATTTLQLQLRREDHCLDCGKCFYLYLDHNGCNCFDDVDDDFCAVCELREDVRYKFPRFPTST